MLSLNGLRPWLCSQQASSLESSQPVPLRCFNFKRQCRCEYTPLTEVSENAPFLSFQCVLPILLVELPMHWHLCRACSSVIEYSALEPQGDKVCYLVLAFFHARSRPMTVYRVRKGSERMTARSKSSTDFRVEWLDASGSSLKDEDSVRASSLHLSGMDGNSDFTPTTSPEYLPNDCLKRATGSMGTLAFKRRSELKLFY